MKEFLKKVQDDQAVFGTMVSIFDNPEISRVLKNAGMEWFFYDTEHGYPNIDRMYGIFAYARFVGIPVFIRIPEVNKTEVFRALDAGADGIICPNVETAAQAKELVRLGKYAPLGERGISLGRPHTGYQKWKTTEYAEYANANTIIITQIESPIGVANVDEILAVDGVWGVLIGPNDLSSSLGLVDQLDHPEYLAAVERIFDSCKKNGKVAGISGKDIEVLKYWRSRGARLLQWGTDVSLFTSKVKEGVKAFHES